MDGRNRALDNIFVERFWRTLKYEDIYLKNYETMSELKLGLNRFFVLYKDERLHQSLDCATPNEVYESSFSHEQAALKASA
jgi:putative transposase